MKRTAPLAGPLRLIAKGESHVASSPNISPALRHKEMTAAETPKVRMLADMMLPKERTVRCVKDSAKAEGQMRCEKYSRHELHRALGAPASTAGPLAMAPSRGASRRALHQGSRCTAARQAASTGQANVLIKATRPAPTAGPTQVITTPATLGASILQRRSMHRMRPFMSASTPLFPFANATAQRFSTDSVLPSDASFATQPKMMTPATPTS
mmetsp:Transcript_102992/g.315090  ORF Transcript_102992/g.315090 Transcript_102992/m.315090 type:complete len:212 (+) Transcript_102992:233-868(+)